MSGGLEASINEGGMKIHPTLQIHWSKIRGTSSDVTLQVPTFLQVNANW